MRTRRHTHPPEETGIDLAPMLDFVLNLLIFFIITNTFVSEAGIHINRPSASTAVKQERANVLVAIAPNGEVWSDGQRVDIRALRAHLQKRRQENPNAAVIVQADRDARAGLVVEAMDQARLAGFKNVAIAATPQTSP
ncbi:ExbD/TolR family protein [Solimonas terrae]|uniref:Biopolymer transporter ExbD n=1 Tax=Solimonas terrae TaxID=1396819 RepID=A0A6M2BM83_9GAMM|nr:biopolymer transporter ExbD [Solimonas terrae]NGY03706.1 biopolymer transporter ExbD [Solimonas terrae]